MNLNSIETYGRSQTHAALIKGFLEKVARANIYELRKNPRPPDFEVTAHVFANGDVRLVEEIDGEGSHLEWCCWRLAQLWVEGEVEAQMYVQWRWHRYSVGIRRRDGSVDFGESERPGLPHTVSRGFLQMCLALIPHVPKARRDSSVDSGKSEEFSDGYKHKND